MSALSLRKALLEDTDSDMRRRRSIIVLSLIGVAAMGAVTLLQSGIVKHLPDPPVEGFDSDKVNTSQDAYQFGVPDGALGMVAYAVNVPLAAWGGADRAHKKPWASQLAAGKAFLDLGIAARMFTLMPRKEKAWCGYCLLAALSSLSVFALSLPEAIQAIKNLRGKF